MPSLELIVFVEPSSLVTAQRSFGHISHVDYRVLVLVEFSVRGIVMHNNVIRGDSCGYTGNGLPSHVQYEPITTSFLSSDWVEPVLHDGIAIILKTINNVTFFSYGRIFTIERASY